MSTSIKVVDEIKISKELVELLEYCVNAAWNDGAIALAEREFAENGLAYLQTKIDQ